MLAAGGVAACVSTVTVRTCGSPATVAVLTTVVAGRERRLGRQPPRGRCRAAPAHRVRQRCRPFALIVSTNAASASGRRQWPSAAPPHRPSVPLCRRCLRTRPGASRRARRTTETLLRILRERALEDRVDRRRQRTVEARRRRDRRRCMRRGFGSEGLGKVRPAAAEQLERDDGKAIAVACGGRRASDGLLGGHVAGGAEDRAHARQ